MLPGIAGSNPAPTVFNQLISHDTPCGGQSFMPERKRKEKTKPTPPGDDVVEKIDRKHSDDDFFRDLKKATSDEARKKLGLPSGRGRE